VGIDHGARRRFLTKNGHHRLYRDASLDSINLVSPEPCCVLKGFVTHVQPRSSTRRQPHGRDPATAAQSVSTNKLAGTPRYAPLIVKLDLEEVAPIFSRPVAPLHCEPVFQVRSHRCDEEPMVPPVAHAFA
jgi:hypothetical protein